MDSILQSFIDDLYIICQKANNKTQDEILILSKQNHLRDLASYVINLIASHLTGKTTNLNGLRRVDFWSFINIQMQWVIMFHYLAIYVKHHPDFVPPTVYTLFKNEFLNLPPSHPQLAMNGHSFPHITKSMTDIVLSILKLPYGIGRVENGHSILIQPTQSLHELVR